MPQLGVLQVASRGGRRFRILSQQADSQGLIRAQVQWLAEEPEQPVPAERAGLLPLLRAIAEEAGEARIPQPHVFDDAVWVGYRFAEVLPIPVAARQKLLELDDSLIRLEIIQTYLQQKGVLWIGSGPCGPTYGGAWSSDMRSISRNPPSIPEIRTSTRARRAAGSAVPARSRWRTCTRAGSGGSVSLAASSKVTTKSGHSDT
jgi:hypothetical protein